MSAHEIVAIQPTWNAAAHDASLTGVASVEPQWLRQPGSNPELVKPMEGPSTLVLAIIGAATLIAYRSIYDRLIGVTPTTHIEQPGIKPRRRAA